MKVIEPEGFILSSNYVFKSWISTQIILYSDLELIGSENVTYRFHNVCHSFCLHKPDISTYHEDTNSVNTNCDLRDKIIVHQFWIFCKNISSVLAFRWKGSPCTEYPKAGPWTQFLADSSAKTCRSDQGWSFARIFSSLMFCKNDSKTKTCSRLPPLPSNA